MITSTLIVNVDKWDDICIELKQWMFHHQCRRLHQCRTKPSKEFNKNVVMLIALWLMTLINAHNSCMSTSNHSWFRYRIESQLLCWKHRIHKYHNLATVLSFSLFNDTSNKIWWRNLHISHQYGLTRSLVQHIHEWLVTTYLYMNHWTPSIQTM